MKIAIYARYSSENQSEKSIDLANFRTSETQFCIEQFIQGRYTQFCRSTDQLVGLLSVLKAIVGTINATIVLLQLLETSFNFGDDRVVLIGMKTL